MEYDNKDTDYTSTNRKTLRQRRRRRRAPQRDERTAGFCSRGGGGGRAASTGVPARGGGAPATRSARRGPSNGRRRALGVPRPPPSENAGRKRTPRASFVPRRPPPRLPPRPPPLAAFRRKEAARLSLLGRRLGRGGLARLGQELGAALGGDALLLGALERVARPVRLVLFRSWGRGGGAGGEREVRGPRALGSFFCAPREKSSRCRRRKGSPLVGSPTQSRTDGRWMHGSLTSTRAWATWASCRRPRPCRRSTPARAARRRRPREQGRARRRRRLFFRLVCCGGDYFGERACERGAV